jgi:hypothetical protein
MADCSPLARTYSLHELFDPARSPSVFSRLNVNLDCLLPSSREPLWKKAPSA